jgi:putative ABC transport system permease protein
VRGGPVRRAVRGGLTRRRVQTIVIGLVVLVTTGASVLALALLADSNAPFDTAFAAQRGADLTATIDTARTTPGELAATAKIPGVTAAAGPFAEASVSLRLRTLTGGPAGSAVLTLPPMTLAGRAGPGGPADDLSLQSGHWASRPGQVVLAANPPGGGGLPPGVRLGDQLTAAGVAGRVRLTVVGFASSVTGSADGWVAPAQIAALRTAGAAASSELLYRFARAGSSAAVRADAAALATALPPGAVSATQSYLAVRMQETSGVAPIAPFIVAFAVIGLIMSVLIVINVVSGAVVAGYRRIGILKSIGFTPAQVAAAYCAQALIPAAAGCLGGLLLGNLLSAALLSRAASVYQVGALGIPAWVEAAVPVTMLLLAAIAALLPAVRAGRLSATAAIAAGRAPRQGGGHAAYRLLGRTRLPRPVTLGLAAPFARPARTAVTLTAILLGATAVTFAVGLGASLSRVVAGLDLTNTEQVQVPLPTGPAGAPAGGFRVHSGPPPAGGHAQRPRLPKAPTTAQADAAVGAAIAAQSGTGHDVAETDQQVTVAGLTGQIPVTAFRGDARWLGYELISGRWYTGPGQVDVPTYFLTMTGKSLGDSVTFTFGGRQLTARITGEVFDSDNNGLAMITDWATLAAADPSLAQPTQYDIGLRPGTSVAAYAASLGSRLGPGYSVSMAGGGGGLGIILSLIGLLTLLLAAVAGLGVLNTVLLQTRERVHDLGVYKAVGMTPRQTIVMVLCWVAGIGLVAGLAAVPAGIALHRYLVPLMGNAAGSALPASIITVYGAGEVAVLALAGIAIGAASWAAAARSAAALRAE